jgi:DNA-binding transcriptional LysR family regulator
MDLKQLQTFVEVARRGSFAAAARLLGVAPSMVTRSVAALERELGVRLIQRTTRRLSLTEAGAAYCEQVSEVLAGLERAGDEARAAAGEICSGTVRLTSSVAFGQTVVVPLLPLLHKRHPGVEIELVLIDSVIDLVAERVDLALRLGATPDTSLIGLPLRRVRYRVVASEAYLRLHGRPRVPADLAHCDCLRFPLPGFKTEWQFRGRDGPIESVAVHGWLVLSTALALHRAALDGLGPTLLPDWQVGADLAAGRLVDLFPAHEATATRFDSGVWLLYPSRAYVPGRVRAVVDFLKATLAG